MKTLVLLPFDATLEDLVAVLGKARANTIKKIARMLGKKKARLLHKADNLKFILEVAKKETATAVMAYNMAAAARNDNKEVLAKFGQLVKQWALWLLAQKDNEYTLEEALDIAIAEATTEDVKDTEEEANA